MIWQALYQHFKRSLAKQNHFKEQLSFAEGVDVETIYTHTLKTTLYLLFSQFPVFTCWIATARKHMEGNGSYRKTCETRTKTKQMCLHWFDRKAADARRWRRGGFCFVVFPRRGGIVRILKLLHCSGVIVSIVYIIFPNALQAGWKGILSVFQAKGWLGYIAKCTQSWCGCGAAEQTHE